MFLCLLNFISYGIAIYVLLVGIVKIIEWWAATKYSLTLQQTQAAEKHSVGFIYYYILYVIL